MSKKHRNIKAYLKHKHCSKVYVICNDVEYEIDLLKRKEIKRSLFAQKTPSRLYDERNYEIINRVNFAKKVQRAKVELSKNLQKLIKANLQIRMIFDYQLFN